jgi:hypothetical protein
MSIVLGLLWPAAFAKFLAEGNSAGSAALWALYILALGLVAAVIVWFIGRRVG